MRPNENRRSHYSIAHAQGMSHMLPRSETSAENPEASAETPNRRAEERRSPREPQVNAVAQHATGSRCVTTR